MCETAVQKSKKHTERNLILKYIEGCFTFIHWNNHCYKASFFPNLVQYNPY